MRRFDPEEIGLERIYGSEELSGYTESPFGPAGCPKINSIYGPLTFPPFPGDRAYTFGSFVMSVDGRIAFPEYPDGTLIAKKNRFDPFGGEADFWILNMLRTAADGVIMGSAALKREPYLTGHIFDPDLTECRLRKKGGEVPLHIIVTSTGRNLPLDHKVITSPDIPVLVAASPEGAKRITEACHQSFRLLTACGSGRTLSDEAAADPARPLLIGLGEGSKLAPEKLLAFLKQGGVHSALIESPTFLSNLMAEKFLDEMFLNTSGIFVGGDALSLGDHAPPFSAENHPHTKIVTIHRHSDSFFYFRYRLVG